MMLSGGSFFGKKRLAIFESYGTITTPWGGTCFLLRVRENSLTHVFDPCWNRGRRLLTEEENLLVLADGSKTKGEKSPENRPTQIWENLIQSGLECVVSPNLAVKAACLADP